MHHGIDYESMEGDVELAMGDDEFIERLLHSLHDLTEAVDLVRVERILFQA